MGKGRRNSRTRVLGKGTASEDPELGLGLKAGAWAWQTARQGGQGGREPGRCAQPRAMESIHSLVTVSSATQEHITLAAACFQWSQVGFSQNSPTGHRDVQG